MASIGELTATVRADVSGFVGPMQQVVTTTQRTASQVQSIVQPTQQLGQQLGQTATAGKLFGVSLGSLRGSLASLVSGLAGVPGPLGNIASKFAMFGAGGGVTIAVLAGITAIVAGWRSLTEETRKQEAAVDDLKTSYDEMFGATVRLRREQARQAVADAQRGRWQVIGTGMFGIPHLARITSTEELTRATQALQAAERAYAEHNRSVVEPGMRRAAEANREAARAREAFLNALKEEAAKIDKNEGGSTKKVEHLTKEARAWMELKAQISATVAEEERRRNRSVEKSDVKAEKTLADTTQAVQGARDAAQAMSQAFMTAFTDSKESLTERITSVLRSAVQNAIQRLIEQKLFESFLKAFSPDKGAVSGGVADIAGGVVRGIFGAPPPMAASGGTIIVPLDNLPAPLSPVEVARDAMHQALWMETARVAEGNGFRLTPRMR